MRWVDGNCGELCAGTFRAPVKGCPGLEFWLLVQWCSMCNSWLLRHLVPGLGEGGRQAANKDVPTRVGWKLPMVNLALIQQNEMPCNTDVTSLEDVLRKNGRTGKSTKSCQRICQSSWSGLLQHVVRYYILFRVVMHVSHCKSSPQFLLLRWLGLHTAVSSRHLYFRTVAEQPLVFPMHLFLTRRLQG